MRTPAVRLVPAPPLEPPFDDELGPDAWQLSPEAGAQLTIEWRRQDQPPAAGVGETPDAAIVGASPAAWHAALRFLDRCLEIINGYRPASHARPMSTPMDAQTIVEQLAAVAQRTARRPRTARPGNRYCAVTRRRLHLCEPRPGAAEATATLTQAGRVWAVAFRLEQRGEPWLCTTFLDITAGQ